MLKVEYTAQFKRDLKLSKRRHKNIDRLQIIMEMIEQEVHLHSALKDHALSGNWHSHRELHIEPDWLLIYKYVLQLNTVIFVRVGTHSDLFK